MSLERLKLYSRQILHTGRLHQILASIWQTTAEKRRGQSHMAHFKFRRPQLYLRNGWRESRYILYAGEIYQAL